MTSTFITTTEEEDRILQGLKYYFGVKSKNEVFQRLIADGAKQLEGIKKAEDEELEVKGEEEKDGQ